MTAHQDRFVAETNVARVRFGDPVFNVIGEEIERLGAKRALVLSTPPQAEIAQDLAAAIGPAAAGLFTCATMHTPVEVTEDATDHAKEIEADCLVAMGGGSTIGLAKAIALRTGLPQIAIPTTYAGSEATPILGQTENGQKTTLRDPKVQPGVIIYDPALVATLPVGMTVTSGLNAMAHAVEGLYAQDRSADGTAQAVDGLRAFADGLPEVLRDPSNLSARGRTLYGAWLCGSVLGTVGMALHHKLCHTLGGMFDLPHAETHAIILPHATAYNAKAVPDLLAPVAEIFGGDHPGVALYDFAKSLDAPLALKDLGVTEADLDRAAKAALQAAYWNPRPLELSAIRALLQDAWKGVAPRS
ncbi:MAG: maleylacetate reductase [Pseudomonadota bacterium]